MYITLDEWVEKANTLNKSYNSRKSLRQDCEKKLKDHFVIMEYGHKKLISVYPIHVEETGDNRVHMMRDVKWYHVDKSIRLMDTDKMVAGIVSVLKDKVDVEELIKDALYDSNPETLEEVFERAVVKKGSIKSKEGCYKLAIGGKPGKPFEFMLRD